MSAGNNETVIEEERVVMSDYLSKWMNIQERVRRQKSKAHWISEGDGNNKYFSHI